MMGNPLDPILASLDAKRIPIGGISEWACYYVNYGVQPPDDPAQAIESCVDAHLAAGLDYVIWDAGRSTVMYRSSLENVTPAFKYGDQGVEDRSWAFVPRVMEALCPLRHALAYSHGKGIPLLGRLGMNRHYGSNRPGLASQFAIQHPEYHEQTKTGKAVNHRLCYAIPEVQQERLDILLEVQRIGVDGLVLDFCRQMPILMYHPALTEAFRQMTGTDPRAIDASAPESYMAWFRFRAEVLTSFMRRLREETRRQAAESSRPCPIVARVPDSAPWIMLAYGLDVETWLAEDLVDATMLSPFPLVREDLGSYPAWHAEIAHRHAKACIGGLGSLNLIRNGVAENTGFYHPQPAYARLQEQYEAGVDGMTVYQSETLTRMSYLADLLATVGDRVQVGHLAETLEAPDLPPDHLIGVDWHSRLYSHGLRVSDVGDGAL